MRFLDLAAGSAARPNFQRAKLGPRYNEFINGRTIDSVAFTFIIKNVVVKFVLDSRHKHVYKAHTISAS